MQALAAVDIFATKGIEYLLVIGFLMSFVLFWLLLNRPGARALRRAVAAAPARGGWFRLATGLFYHPGHSWIRPEVENEVTVGMDDFAQKLIGRPSALDLPSVGTRLEQGEKGWTVRVGPHTVAMLAPVGGEVVAVNRRLLDTPDLVNDAPYGEGWLLRLRAPRLRAHVRNLLSGELARAWTEDAARALRRAMATDLGPVMQDGGVPVDGIARSLSPEGWEELAARFLLTDSESMTETGENGNS